MRRAFNTGVMWCCGLAVVLTVAACSDNARPGGGGPVSYDYRAHDNAGRAVMTGTIQLDAPPAAGQTIKGHWEFARADPTTAPTTQGDRSSRSQHGLCTATRQGNAVTLDLNPGVPERKVTLSGTLDAAGAINGSWEFAAPNGVKNAGTFLAAPRR